MNYTIITCSHRVTLKASFYEAYKVSYLEGTKGLAIPNPYKYDKLTLASCLFETPCKREQIKIAHFEEKKITTVPTEFYDNLAYYFPLQKIKDSALKKDFSLILSAPRKLA